MKTEEYGNFINGEWIKSRTGGTFENINPADTGDTVGLFQNSGLPDMEEAVASAQAAFGAWRNSALGEREEIFRKAAGILEKRRDELAAELTREEGKTLEESRKEIQSAAGEIRFQAGAAKGFLVESACSEKPGIFCYSVREPLGVVAVVTPWNFPANVVCRKITPALMAGNTVVFKPATFTPLTGLRIAEIFTEAGLPSGVLNFITGRGSRIGDALVTHPLVQAVSFTGSTDVGMKIQEAASRNMKKAQLEMGGKNPTVILEDADLDAAVNGVVLAAYACSGQWCTSTSRLIVMKSVAEEVIARLVGQVKKIVVGNGLDCGVTMGPVAGESQLNKILEYIEIGKREGARLLAGGERLTGGAYDRGFFIQPTVFGGVRPEMRIAQEEIFGPVLSVITVDTFDEAVSVANKVEFGLTSSVYTRDIGRSMDFINKSEVGLAHVNLPTSYKEPNLPFGGIKHSGCGAPEAGRSGIEFFTRNKTVYINYRP